MTTAEKIRNQSYYKTVIENNHLMKCQQKVFKVLSKGNHTMYEISKKTGIPQHIVTARLMELRKKELVIFHCVKKNIDTQRMNCVWSLNCSISNNAAKFLNKK